MSRKFSCFVISPIGVEGSETNRRANEVYEGVIQHVLKGYDVDCLRGDHNASSNHIGADVIRCIREADFCIVDISYPNCNVYYELGLADAMEVPVILLKEKSVDASKLPADVVSRKYTEYSLDGVAALMQSWSNLDAFVRPYVEELKAGTLRPQKGVPAEAPAAQPFQRTMQLPMDLRPKQALSQMEEAEHWELKKRIERLADRGAESELLQCLARYRTLCGDAAYVRMLRKYSSTSKEVWRCYLQCAVSWLAVDHHYCALDVTWLAALADGIRQGYAEQTHYEQVNDCCERVIAISRSFEEREVSLIDATGLFKRYSYEGAYYYQGLCHFNMYKQTGDRTFLKNASDDWVWVRIRSYDAEEAAERRSKRWFEVRETLAQAYLDEEHYRDARAEIEDALKEMDSAEASGNALPRWRRKALLELALEVYLSLELPEAEAVHQKLCGINEAEANLYRQQALKRIGKRKNRDNVFMALSEDERREKAIALMEKAVALCGSTVSPVNEQLKELNLPVDVDACRKSLTKNGTYRSVDEMERTLKDMKILQTLLKPKTAEAEMLKITGELLEKVQQSCKLMDAAVAEMLK